MLSLLQSPKAYNLALDPLSCFGDYRPAEFHASWIAVIVPEWDLVGRAKVSSDSKTRAMASPALPLAATISIAEVLALLDGPFREMAEAVSWKIN
jgi:hypothetical protein